MCCATRCRTCAHSAAGMFNVASIVGFQGGYAGWGYVASKFALAGLTETLAAELAELNIKATVVYPGPVRTGFLSKDTLVVAARSIADYRSPGLLDLQQTAWTASRPATRRRWPR